jgi:hypothetical protein
MNTVTQSHSLTGKHYATAKETTKFRITAIQHAEEN